MDRKLELDRQAEPLSGKLGHRAMSVVQGVEGAGKDGAPRQSRQDRNAANDDLPTLAMQ
ncbi:MAG: hypothetical protein WD894_13390 [Pirellulales bacterium]